MKKEQIYYFTESELIDFAEMIVRIHSEASERIIKRQVDELIKEVELINNKHKSSHADMESLDKKMEKYKKEFDEFNKIIAENQKQIDLLR